MAQSRCVGHRAHSHKRSWMAAVLACGEGAVLSHLSAAGLKNLALGSAIETDGTRSDLERDFLRLCRRHGFPAPEVNVRVGGWTVDFLWREQRVAVETDFYDYHRGRIAFLDDHARDLALRRHKLDVRRYSEEQLNNEPAAVVADLRDALALGGIESSNIR